MFRYGPEEAWPRLLTEFSGPQPWDLTAHNIAILHHHILDITGSSAQRPNGEPWGR